MLGTGANYNIAIIRNVGGKLRLQDFTELQYATVVFSCAIISHIC